MDVSLLQKTLDVLKPGTPNGYAEACRVLTPLVRELLEKDFAQLVQVLYRIDVDEEKLKRTLAANPEKDAAAVIAELMVQRHLQKVHTKATHKKPPPSAEERW